MRDVFALEVEALGINAPQLVIEKGIIPGPGFFDFDLEHPSSGKVILNPTELAKLEDPYSSLSLLIHETRHSAQLQLAFKETSPLAHGYHAAFSAQKILKGLSFCDFTLLLNEYEAFQFSNFILGSIVQNNLFDMGTFASQYDNNGNPKIDLPKLADEIPVDQLLLKFNELEKEQYRLLGGKE